MDWDRIAYRLEAILGRPAVVERLSAEAWKKLSGDAGNVQERTGNASAALRTEGSITTGSHLWFPLEARGQTVHALRIGAETLGAAERQLVEWVLEQARAGDKPRPAVPAASEEERKAQQLASWLQRQLDGSLPEEAVPRELADALGLRERHIPLLLQGDFTSDRKVSLRELKKLLDSFFDSDAIVIPLADKEYLLLSPEELLADSGSDEAEESVEDALLSLCSGLHEMLAAEWMGECHLCINMPINPVRELTCAVACMRQTIELGKRFRVGDTIHAPWTLHLERLLASTTDAERRAFVDWVFKRNRDERGLPIDQETLTTIEQFFAADCNVSETAKRLYIHRNTLLYRLDRFKQSTGLDVRSFGDAVFVKVALLLYKVTKTG